jgi:hypothetical protein
MVSKDASSLKFILTWHQSQDLLYSKYRRCLATIFCAIFNDISTLLWNSLDNWRNAARAHFRLLQAKIGSLSETLLFPVARPLRRPFG